MSEPFLRIPPFPGHRAQPMSVEGDGVAMTGQHAIELVGLLRKHRVGGSFWASQPPLPDGCNLLLAPDTIEQCHEMMSRAACQGLIARCVLLAPAGRRPGRLPTDIPVIEGPANPWFLADMAVSVWAGAEHELALVASLAGKTPLLFGDGRFARCDQGEEQLALTAAETIGTGLAYRCPFTGERISPPDAIELLGSWRQLIDRNRRYAGVAGVAAWKRPTVDPLLWNGSGLPRHIRRAPDRAEPVSSIAAWKSRTRPALLDRLNRSATKIAEIEDGMIRGPGLGANCVPPLSLVVDELGIYFDPSAPSELEQILQTAEMDADLVERAARLRRQIVQHGIGKYGIGGSASAPCQDDRRRVLVVGQVEDDRSVLTGGTSQTNLELLVRARELEPDAWLIYRPHPDVEAGHRKGHVADEIALRHADEVDRNSAIAALIERVGTIHCITSLAGFEGLMRGKQVTTHGVPFYAGWGLSSDLGDVPARRTRRRTLDELVAGALILYPRYLDPVARLPCPPEILVERIARGEAAVAAPLSNIRKLQGKLKLALRGLQRAAA